MTDTGFDFVVVGGGMAGMIAAVRAAELGLSVAVLEKGGDDRYLCNARYSGGIFHIAYNDVKHDPEALRAAVRAATNCGADPALTEALVADGPRLVEWLRQQGARFIRGGPAWQNWMLAPPRPLVGGLDWKGRGPDVLLRQLGERLRGLGGTLALGTEVTGLRMQDGRCTGVEARRADGSVTYAAQAVLIADGGFQADLALVGRWISPAPDRLKQRGAQTGAGTGLRIAQEAGAAVTTLNEFYGHLLSRDAMHNDRVWPYPELDAVAAAGLLVGAEGRRFADEGRGGIFLANAVARRPDPLAACIVCDAAIWDGPGRSARIPANPQLERAGATIHRAADLAAAAAVAGLPAEAVQATVADYNRSLADGALQTLDPPRSSGKYQAMPIAAAPFLVIPVCVGITYTMGGLRIDAAARVLSTAAAPIPGLFAAGATTGGLEGGGVAGYVGGLIKSGVFGLRAAENAARQSGRT